jgi:hypothetical protein
VRASMLEIYNEDIRDLLSKVGAGGSGWWCVVGRRVRALAVCGSASVAAAVLRQRSPAAAACGGQEAPQLSCHALHTSCPAVPARLPASPHTPSPLPPHRTPRTGWRCTRGGRAGCTSRG